MTRKHILTFFFLVALSAGALASDIAKIAWLGGCWKNDSAEAGSVEQWLPLVGETLLGVSRTVKQGKTVTHEFMQIRADVDGKLTFFAIPAGQPAASFALLRISEREVAFENLQHDFPQRVIYAFDGGNKLNARIEGMRNGAVRSVLYPMSRVSCDSLLTPAIR